MVGAVRLIIKTCNFHSNLKKTASPMAYLNAVFCLCRMWTLDSIGLQVKTNRNKKHSFNVSKIKEDDRIVVM